MAERTGIDPTVVRVIAVVLAIFGGIGVLLYGLAWLLLPEPDGRIHAEQVLHGKVDAGAVGAIVVTVLSLGGGPGGGWDHWGCGFGWHSGLFGLLWGLTGSAVVIAVIVFVVYLAVRGRGRRRWPRAGPGRRTAVPDLSVGSGSAPPGVTRRPGYAGRTAELPDARPPSQRRTRRTAAPATLTAPPLPAAPGPARLPGRPAGTRAGVRRSAGSPRWSAAWRSSLPASRVLVTHDGHYPVSTAAMAWAVALGVIALALVVGGLLGRRSGVVTAVRPDRPRRHARGQP